MRRLALLLLSLLLLIPLGLGAFGYYLARSALPQLAGAASAPGLGAAVEVLRDERGVPHIYAGSEHDLFFAQGYITAQDRLWQMEVNRRTAWGRLAEVFGEAGLEADRLFRTFGLGRAARAEEALLSPEERGLLQAYADGVNAYVRSQNGTLPWEFRLLLVGFEPWQPVDSLAWAKLLAWQLGSNYSAEVLRAALLERLSPAQVARLMPSVPEGVIPHVATDLPPRGLGRSLLQRLRAVTGVVRPPSSDLGSNNWVISGARTVTGRPLLANDPHLAVQMPPVWYAVHLSAGEIDAYGFSMPGLPGLITGHNRRIAWGITNTGADVQDLYVERRNPENPNQYLYEGVWEDAWLVRESIQVRGWSQPVELTVPHTRHGPVLNAEAADEQPLALRWTALEPSPMARSITKLLVAGNWTEFTEALRDFSAPAQNFVYADVEGNIGLQVAGLVPLRARGDGLLPVPGWRDEYEWTGFIPFEALPREYNPEAGLIVTANNRLVGDDYPYHITHEWAPDYRLDRITALLATKGPISLEDSRIVQLDVRSELAAALVPHILHAAGTVGAHAVRTPGMEAALEELRRWDFEMTANTVAGTIVHVFYNQLLAHVLADELGADDLDLYRGDSRSHLLALTALLREGGSAWFDDVGTPAVEGRDEAVWRSFVAAVDALTARFGDDPKTWEWQRLHTVTFASPLGAVPVLGKAVSLGPYPRGGDGTTVNVSGYSFIAPYREAHQPSFRMLLDVGQWDGSLSVLTTGQSGQVLSTHYRDQVALWLEGRYHSTPFSAQRVRDAAVNRLLLVP